MTTEKMTLTQALSELKIISNRLHYEIENATFCGVKKHMDTNVKGVSVDEAKKSMQASFDKVTNLINRQEAIKKALTKANAETSIVVAGKQMMMQDVLFFIGVHSFGIHFQGNPVTKIENNTRHIRKQCQNPYHNTCFKQSF